MAKLTHQIQLGVVHLSRCMGAALQPELEKRGNASVESVNYAELEALLPEIGPDFNINGNLTVDGTVIAHRFQSPGADFAEMFSKLRACGPRRRLLRDRLSGYLPGTISHPSSL